jgi:hypothetical protein
MDKLNPVPVMVMAEKPEVGLSVILAEAWE